MKFIDGLETLGWNTRFIHDFEPYKEKGYDVGRIVLEHKHIYRIYTETAELLGEVSGKMRHTSTERGDFPAVGDWVAFTPFPGENKALIHAVLPRFSKISRKVAGKNLEEQIVAANVDTLFLVNALDQDFNPRRMERYLIMAWESGATPVILLSKADLCPDVEAKVRIVEQTAIGAHVHVVSAEQDFGLEALNPYLQKGKTIALVGSSGVGKSTLINKLCGEEVQLVSEVRAGDHRGRHTTTHRELILLPGGGMLIDTPGMRELQLWEAGEGWEETFEDIEGLAGECFFRDCSHEREKGCAVQEALASGRLDPARYKNYRKLQRELAFQTQKEDKKLQMAAKEKQKKIAVEIKQLYRDRKRPLD